MAGESNADVYASFGANNAVVTSGSVEDHEQNMLALDVETRDGDDRINLVDSESDIYATGDKFAAEGEDDGRMQVRINGESGEATVDGELSEGDSNSETDGEDFAPLGETPSELTESSQMLEQHEQGFQEMINQAAERGLPTDAIERIQEEYEGEGISEGSYEELAKAGYSKAFVDSYIKGQEALVESYVNQIKEFAGGDAKFSQLVTHLETNDGETLEALYEAMGRRDLATVKVLINAAGVSRSKRFGTKPARTTTTKAVPSKAAPSKAEGFGSQAEMVAAMSDPRYRTDATYRREVEQKVGNTGTAW